MSISDAKVAAIEAAAKDAVRCLEFDRGGIDEALDRARERRDGAEAVAKLATPRDLLALITRMRAAEAVVARLPVTADGVPVTPGMSLWYLIVGRAAEAHFRSDAIPHDARAYYSTEAAALAAKGGTV